MGMFDRFKKKAAEETPPPAVPDAAPDAAATDMDPELAALIAARETAEAAPPSQADPPQAEAPQAEAPQADPPQAPQAEAEPSQDDEIMRLLQIDEAADNAANPPPPEEDDGAGEDINRQRIYIHVGDDEPEGEIAASRVKFSLLETLAAKASKRALLGVAAGLLAVIVLCSVAAAVIWVRRPKPTGYAVPASAVGFVYLNFISELDGEEIILQKMLCDELATVFYFERRFEPEDVRVTLKDDLGNLYTADETFAPYAAPSAPSQTMLRFNPLPAEAGALTMYFDGEPVFGFRFDKKRGTAPVGLGAGRAELPDVMRGVSIDVSTARFSDSGSELEFAVNWANNGEPLFFREESGAGVSMTQGNVLLPVKTAPNMYSFDEQGAIIGRMDYQPAKNPAGKAEVTFKGLFRKVPVDRQIFCETFYDSKDDAGVRLRANGVDIFIERMFYSDGAFVLVLHGELPEELQPETAEGEPPKPEDNRVELVVDATLTARLRGGQTIEMAGISRSKREGSDVTFNAGVLNGLADLPDGGDLLLSIRSVSAALGDVTVPLDMRYGYAKAYKAAEKRTVVADSVTDAFKARLGYKFGEDSSESPFAAFAAGSMNSEVFNALYAREPGAEGAGYDVQVIACVNDAAAPTLWEAAVRETWMATVNGHPQYVTHTHKITCKLTDDAFLILSDEIAE